MEKEREGRRGEEGEGRKESGEGEGRKERGGKRVVKESGEGEW